MPKVLIADDARNVRNVLTFTLKGSGYDVVEARDGKTTYEKACQTKPHIILLGVTTPGMDGFEVLKRLKENPDTSEIPIVMLTAMSATKGEHLGLTLGATHYITKPWQPRALENVMRSALRDAGLNHILDDLASGDGLDVSGPRQCIRTGYTPLDEKLSGGIPVRSLTLIDGEPSIGKSVLCQQIAYEALQGGYEVAYFNSEHTPRSLVTQMDSIGRDALAYYQKGKLNLYPLEGSAPDWDARQCADPEHLLTLLTVEMEHLPREFMVVILDAITNLAIHSREKIVLNFFAACKRLSDIQDRTIIVAAREYCFDGNIRSRVQALCETHINMRAEEIGRKRIKMLQVVRSDNATMERSNSLGYDVLEGIGFNNVPGIRVKI